MKQPFIFIPPIWNRVAEYELFFGKNKMERNELFMIFSKIWKTQIPIYRDPLFNCIWSQEEKTFSNA